PITATINLEALRHNLRVVAATAPHSRIMAVVKANGYGHGLLNVAKGLAAADGFAVLNLQEAIDLRQAGHEQTLLLLEGAFSVDELELASLHHITLVVHNSHQIDMLEQAKLTQPISVFAKLNTGMNRLGFAPVDYRIAIQRLEACQNIDRITLMTHFATADEPSGIEDPFRIFKETTEGLTYPVSLANSAAILRYPYAHADWVRPGIMLYGASPVAGTPASEFGLRPAMSLHSEVIAIQSVRKGESVGYGCTFTAACDTRVAVIACGYADGYPRHAPNGTPIHVAGKTTKTVGRVSMDMLFADVSDIPDAVIGSPVELWGDHNPVDAVAEAAGTVGYELLCALAPRVPVKVIG
ncbi:MAG TPA: alanine racemase, partial [Methylophilaceae bacterium]|nr:alanine racemase [Methylophilaceae bacterium]